MDDQNNRGNLVYKRFTEVFSKLKEVTKLRIYLFNINADPENKKNPPLYAGMEIEINDGTGKLEKALLEDIYNQYIGADGSLKGFIEAKEYDGTADKSTIYFIDSADEKIMSSVVKFRNMCNNTSDTGNPIRFDKAYCLNFKCPTTWNSDGSEVYLISVRSPVINLRRAVLLEQNQFKPVEAGHYLTLGSIMDVVIIDGTVCFLTLRGENLFNLESFHETKCTDSLQTIKQAGIIGDFDAFSKQAKLKKNVRKFTTLDEQCIKDCEDDRKMLRHLAGELGIRCTQDHKFAVDRNPQFDRLIDMFCGRATNNPYHEYKKWLQRGGDEQASGDGTVTPEADEQASGDGTVTPGATKVSVTKKSGPRNRKKQNMKTKMVSGTGGVLPG